ncbi:MAG: glycosyltransferase N-terminal domain-containing protein [Bacteroidota bacterium]|nr:glycosyltransferase N-terminal domain-containing protein [Bacteroidota bacterium]
MFLYNLVIYLYGIVIKLASINKLKAKQWVAGRKNWRAQLSHKISKLNADKIIWVHCSSYGEFEQGRPLIEAIKKKHSHYKIVLSFFSPSGYEEFKEWSGADVICYLPLDTKKNAKDFIDIVKPKASIFIKYEFWLNFLFELQKQAIPTYLVSAVFKPHHPFFKWYGGIFRKSLKTFNTLFIQDETSSELLKQIGLKNYEVCGDTRFDRVIEVKNNFEELPFIKEFCLDNKVIVAGSTWQGDEELLIEAYKILNLPDLKLIIVPHNIEEKNISRLTKLLSKNETAYNLFSEQKLNSNTHVLVADVMGLLSKIYYYANVTYVGGGLDDGIHNCLEPAVYFKPVLFYGNDYHKFNEAVELIEIGAAKNISSSSQLAMAVLNYLNNKIEVKEIEAKLKMYFEKKSGTTKRVLEILNLNT